MTTRDPRIREATLTANEHLLDRAIRHALILERFKAGEVRRIMRFLNSEVIPDLLERIEGRLNRIALRGFDSSFDRTRRFKDLVATIDQMVLSASGELAALLRSDLFGLATSESQWQINRLRSAFQGLLPVDFDFVSPSPNLLRSVVTARPFQGKFLRDEWREWTARTKSNVKSAINIGLAQGESIPNIVRRLRGTRARGFADGALNASRRDATRITRTAVNHVSAHARQATFKENESVIGRVQIVATLDSRTSQICASLDGSTYPVRSGPRPPFHPNCRTTVVPVLKSFRELGIPGLKDFPVGERAAREVLGGRVSAAVNFEDWWRRLPTDRQDAIMGKGVSELLRGQRVTFKQLIDKNLRPLSLEELLRVAERAAA